jgi:hypothetical protein
MKILSKLGLSVAVGLLAAACSSNNSPSSSGSTTGSTSGSGTGSTSGAGTGAASGAASGAATGAASGTSAEAGTGAASGSASGATSGTTSAEASTTEASTTEEASVEAATTAPDAAASATSLTAACNAAGSVYHTSATGTAFTPTDFCTLFISICSTKIVAANAAFGAQATCETAWENLTGAQQSCRTDHLCNAAASVASEDPHCYHAQGWNSATVQTGGPCN